MSGTSFLREVSKRLRRHVKPSSNASHPRGGPRPNSIVHRVDSSEAEGSIEAWAEIARQCGTDQLAHIQFFWEHFHSLQALPFTMLEIGVFRGQSLEVWKKIFPRAKIHALDINPDCARYADSPRVEIMIGSQNDPKVLARWVRQIAGPIDVIIDDGSHMMEHLRTSFQHLFPRLRSGGVYVIEDLGTCYMPEYGGGIGKPDTMMEMLKSLVDDINEHWSGTGNPFRVDHIHFYGNITFVYKK